MSVPSSRAAVVPARPVASRMSKPWLGGVGTGPCPGAGVASGLGCRHRPMRRDARPGIGSRRVRVEGGFRVESENPAVLVVCSPN